MYIDRFIRILGQPSVIYTYTYIVLYILYHYTLCPEIRRTVIYTGLGVAELMKFEWASDPTFAVAGTYYTAHSSRADKTLYTDRAIT